MRMQPRGAVWVVFAAFLAGCASAPPVPSPALTPKASVAKADSYALGPPPPATPTPAPPAELTPPSDEPLAVSEIASPVVAIPPGDIWQRMRGGFSLSSDRFEVRDAARHLLAGRKHLNSTLQRAEPYLWHLVEEVEARGLPIEIALLPAIESAYNPYAYSRSHALGLWQFLPGTGERFGLRRNWWYDGRRDVTESTRAALEYLSYLHGMFGDWLLALAAYNSGEGRVQQAQQDNRARGLATDFWSIALPAETRSYVPRLLGLAELLANPQRYDYRPQPLADCPQFEMVQLPGQVELELAAKLIDLDPAVLQQLNPGYNRWATDPNGPHRLLVPHGRGEKLRTTMAGLKTGEMVRWHHYVVDVNDDLDSIAHRYGVKTALLKEVNGLSGRSLRTGATLRIPRAFARDVPLSKNEIALARGTTSHVIQPGDSLSRIATRHGVRVKDLLRWNNLAASATLRPGRKLLLQTGTETTLHVSNRKSLEPAAKQDFHQVKQGESLWVIARRFGISVSDLQRWNNLATRQQLKIGQRLKVTGSGPRTTGT